MTENLKRYVIDLDDILNRWGISGIVGADTITKWLKETDPENRSFQNAVNILAGLIASGDPNENIKIGDMLKPLLDIYFEVNRDRFKGDLQERENILRNALKNVPSLGYSREYNEAIHLLAGSKFDDSASRFNGVFRSLMDENTTDRTPYVLFLNAAHSYFMAGKSEVGKACLEYSNSLNPNFTPASEMITLMKNGDMDEIMELGRKVAYLQSIFQDDDKIKISDITNIPVHFLITGLSSIGLDPVIDEIKAMMKRHNSAEALVKVEFPELEEPEFSIVFFSMIGLWDRLNLGLPCFEMIEDQIFKISVLIGDMADDEEILEEIGKLEKMLSLLKNGSVEEWSRTEDFEDTDMDLIMDILIYMDGMENLRKRGLKIAELFMAETVNPLWVIPVSFLKEEDTITVVQYLHDMNIPDMEGEQDVCYIDQFLSNRDAILSENYLDDDHPEEDEEDLEDDDGHPEDNEEDLQKDYQEDDDRQGKYDDLADDFVNSLLGKFSKEAEDDPDDDLSLDVLFHPASVYYRFLKGMGMDFTTEEPVDDTVRPLPEPEVKRKIGRNEPCPCGSGLKYKKCCLKKEKKRG